jgi:putative ABC transport system substrate-binding protein
LILYNADNTSDGLKSHTDYNGEQTDWNKAHEEGKMNRVTGRGVFLLAMLSLMIHLFAVEGRAEKRIGVLLWNDEARYIECKDGILEQLKKEGFGEPAVRFVVGNAENSKAKLAELVRQFSTAKMDLILTIGTVATVAVSKEIEDVPVVFSAIYDPVEAGIAKSWKSSGNNTTGASTRIPVSTFISTLKEVTPLKRLALLYTRGEKHTEIQLTELEKIKEQYQIKVIPIILSNREDVAPTLSGVVQTVDAMYLTGSSIVNAAIPLIVDMANKAKVVTITPLPDYVDKGALLGVCANYYLVGRLSGKKAAKILRGAKPSSIPLETEKRVDLILNMKTAKAGLFQIPPSVMKKMTKTIE